MKYVKIIQHGHDMEKDNNQNTVLQMNENDENMDDRLEDMIYDIGESSYMKAHIHDTLCIDKDVSLYKGCTSFTRLSEVLNCLI